MITALTLGHCSLNCSGVWKPASWVTSSLGFCLLWEELGGKGSSKKSCSKCLHFLQDDLAPVLSLSCGGWLDVCKPHG